MIVQAGACVLTVGVLLVLKRIVFVMLVVAIVKLDVG